MIEKEKIFLFDKRRASRIHVPPGTTSLLINRDSSLDRIFIRDISVFGMRISFTNKLERYPLKSKINDVLIHIPPGEENSTGRRLILIYNGKIAHSTFDPTTQTLCYGIEFTHKSLHINQKIEKIVNDITKNKTA